MDPAMRVSILPKSVHAAPICVGFAGIRTCYLQITKPTNQPLDQLDSRQFLLLLGLSFVTDKSADTALAPLIARLIKNRIAKLEQQIGIKIQTTGNKEKVVELSQPLFINRRQRHVLAVTASATMFKMTFMHNAYI